MAVLENRAILKEKAAQDALDLIESDMVLGLGTGSTTRFAIELIGQRLKDGSLKNIVGIPSSLETEKLAKSLGIPLTNFQKHPEIDLTIVGADEVDTQLDLIKGGGGALLREKIIAQASHRTVIIVDEGKISSALGTLWTVPVEVIPFAWQLEAIYLKALQASVVLRKTSVDSPFTTDQGNFILDCDFGPITDPEELSFQLNQRAGIMEHGLFLDLATDVIVAGEEQVSHLQR
jgi:ribose 5-phosphate isomerase A